MAVPPERPQPARAELPFQPAPQQLQHVPRGVDVPVPEVCLGLTVGTVQDVPGELECDLHARKLRVAELPHLCDLLRLLLGRLLLCSDVHLVLLPLHLREEPGFVQTLVAAGARHA
jgi:hypothetical protein